ncbi:PEP-CTERM/exosortase system-associated acyltransferase [Halomonas sp. PGE1]|uniref:PEP-CTERM/exosortase system-associated acyltransferase n=1 Tax=Halomonas sp. PGE1 TaxID=2730360 RepID=UPI001475426E|nr:PEP-CTERM/exosortase system-associated acyltransferase [Halomonas sp. PGE1]QJR00175.1 PEP-CTERM/exosortase system-associated acyltransferase [Halomonas sp. PGE1]
MAQTQTSWKNREATDQLLARFVKEFRFCLATSPQDKKRIFRLRYDVYCEELGYEEPADSANGLEFDAYDQHAIHCLIEHRRTGLTAACTRLVMPNPSLPAPLDRLPLETYGGQSLTHPVLHPERLDKATYYEISRLAVARIFRSRIQDTEVPGITTNPHEFSASERETFPFLVSGLFLAGYALGRMSGKEIAFAMMEPRLPRLLAMAGFHFTKVGETIEFHGQRSAYCITREQADAGMQLALAPLYRHIQEVLGPQLERVLHGESTRVSAV